MPGFKVKFWREGERYYSQASGQIEFELLPLSDTTFSVQGLNAVVVFRPTQLGPVGRLTWRQNGSTYAYTRVPPQPEPAIQRAQFIGKYYTVQSWKLSTPLSSRVNSSS